MKKLTIEKIETSMPMHTTVRTDSGELYYTLNSLMYNLRVIQKCTTWCLASEDGLSISNVSQTYVPSRHLARFVRITEISNEYKVVFFEWVKHPTHGWRID